MKRFPAWITALAAAGTVAASPAAAQEGDTAGRPVQSVGAAERRAQMERLQARLGEVVRERLGLDEEQARRLAAVDRRYQPERRRLVMREMRVRQELRRQLAAGDAADQRAVDGLLRELIALQREHVELGAREQQELAAFLTPVQRAKFMALQADLQRRIATMRRGAGPRDGGPRRSAPGESGPRRGPPQWR